MTRQGVRQELWDTRIFASENLGLISDILGNITEISLFLLAENTAFLLFLFCFFTTAQAHVIGGIDDQYAESVRQWNTRELNQKVMAYGGSRRRGHPTEDYNMGRRGHGVYKGRAFGGSSRTRYSHAYGGTRRRWTPGYDRTGGFYGRYANYNMPGGELKFHNFTLDDAVISAAGTVTASINLIAQGITESTRNGRKCTLKSLSWRYQVALPETNDVASPGSSDTVRIILYIDGQCNGATAAVTDILESDNFQSFRNLANTQRFKILLDKNHTLNYGSMASDGAGTVAQAGVQRDYQFHKKLDIPLEFDNTTGAITEIRSNNIGVLLLSANGVCAFFSQFRLRFSDASARC